MMNSNTFREIVELLTPLMENQTSRESLVYSALLNEPIAKQIDFSGAPHDFVIGLVKKLDAYGTISTGELALVALLNTAKEQVGFDKQQQIDRLIGVLAQPTHYQKPTVANEIPKRSLLETLLSSPLWTGISGIVTIFALIIAYMALPQQNEPTPTPPPSATLTLTTIVPTATLTDTATNTPQPTATYTPLPTLTDLPTATYTPILTFTDVPTDTPLPPSHVPNFGSSPTIFARTYPCEGQIVFTTGALLNVVRVLPSTSSPTRPPVRQGTNVTISAEQYNDQQQWYEIEYGDNSGWIPDEYVVKPIC